MRKAVLGLYTYLEFFGLAVVFVPLLGLATLRHPRDARRRGQWMRRFGRVTSGLTPLWRFSVEGQPPASIDRSAYLVVSNHESTADPFLLSWLPWDMRWIAKEELFKLPLIGWLMKLSADIPLRRGDKDSVLRMIETSKETLSSGLSVMMFPEGTRSPDGALLPFKDGAFEIAIAAQVPVLPIAIQGTRTCRPKGSLWFGDARAIARVLEPISTSGMTVADVPRLRDEARARIARGVETLRSERRAELTGVGSARAQPEINRALKLGGSSS